MTVNLVLASGSPRRQELLRAAGYRFRVIIPSDDVEADLPNDLEPSEYVSLASLRKAEYVAQSLSNEFIIAADTIAVCRGAIIGKPRDIDHAGNILRFLRGQRHQVLTGVSVGNVATGLFRTYVESTVLQMADISERRLNHYLQSGLWQGKAGAFGYQDESDWLQIVDGLESNVVGLPIERLPEWIESVRGIPGS